MKLISDIEDFGELRQSMEAYGIGSRVRKYLDKCVTFHSYIAPGLVIGVYMVDYALELLDARPGDRLYAVAETVKCVPDPLQVIAHCTIGNHRMRVLPYGKFAITLNRPSDKQLVEGVRVYLDPVKVSQYTTIHAWYSKSPRFDPETMIYSLLDEILKAGRQILSYERVLVKVPEKQKWHVMACRSCKEMVPDVTCVNGICEGCSPKAYYEKLDRT